MAEEGNEEARISDPSEKEVEFVKGVAQGLTALGTLLFVKTCAPGRCSRMSCLPRGGSNISLKDVEVRDQQAQPNREAKRKYEYGGGGLEIFQLQDRKSVARRGAQDSFHWLMKSNTEKQPRDVIHVHSNINGTVSRLGRYAASLCLETKAGSFPRTDIPHNEARAVNSPQLRR